MQHIFFSSFNIIVFHFSNHIHRRRGDAKANVTKKSALFGPLVMQNGFKV